jgi:hypothetical protein
VWSIECGEEPHYQRTLKSGVTIKRYRGREMLMRARMAVFGLVLVACTARGRSAPATSPQPSTIRLSVRARSDSFTAAAADYREMWKAEGARIVSAMESVSGLRFDAPPEPDTVIYVEVYEGVSYSGSRGIPPEAQRPMLMRASYPPDTKGATLVHELGHRLQIGIARRAGVDEHEVLALWLYDTWVLLWGKTFADSQVVVERRRRGPYARAWDAALALTAEERAARFRSLRAAR